MKKGLNTFLAMVLALGTTGLAFATSAEQVSPKATTSADARIEQRLAGEVRHELNMIPQFTVFDNLAYRVDGGTVTLFGDHIHILVEDADRGRTAVEAILRKEGIPCRELRVIEPTLEDVFTAALPGGAA